MHWTVSFSSDVPDRIRGVFGFAGTVIAWSARFRALPWRLRSAAVPLRDGVGRSGNQRVNHHEQAQASLLVRGFGDGPCMAVDSHDGGRKEGTDIRCHRHRGNGRCRRTLATDDRVHLREVGPEHQLLCHHVLRGGSRSSSERFRRFRHAGLEDLYGGPRQVDQDRTHRRYRPAAQPFFSRSPARATTGV